MPAKRPFFIRVDLPMSRLLLLDYTRVQTNRQTNRQTEKRTVTRQMLFATIVAAHCPLKTAGTGPVLDKQDPNSGTSHAAVVLSTAEVRSYQNTISGSSGHRSITPTPTVPIDSQSMTSH